MAVAYIFVLPLQLVWKLSGDKPDMELKKKVTQEIAADSNIQVDFSGLQEEADNDDNGNGSHY